mgnify:CR=1 FL=1|jgi:hypothetical protein|nr:MAG TPA: hypothetical protein [Caudoviricetes sp.]
MCCKDCAYCRKWGYDYVCYNYKFSISGFIVSPFKDACAEFKKKESEE